MGLRKRLAGVLRAVADKADPPQARDPYGLYVDLQSVYRQQRQGRRG